MTWATAEQRDELHPALVAELDVTVADAVAEGLRPVFLSGARNNRKQKALHDAFLIAKAAWNANPVGKPPLPAAPPGASAHNWEINGKPASAAVDIMLLDEKGQRIPSGGALPFAKRDARWQTWAKIVARNPKLRDGGTFKNPDPVHVELARWDYKSRTVRPG